MNELGLETVDLLKLDVEGAEFDVLRAAQRRRDIGTIIGELHNELNEGSDTDDLATLLGPDFDVEVESAENGRPTFTAVNRAKSFGGD